MKSYTQLRNNFGVDTKNTGSTNLTNGDTWINDFYRKLLAKADWPFLHRLRTLTTFAPTSAFTAVAATDICTATSTILTLTGTEVTFTTTATLPAGLSTSTTYYLIYQSATTFKVATSLANALAGTAVDITDTGTGTHTVKVTTASQPLPYDVDQVESVFVTVSTTRYTPKPAPSRKFWDELHYSSHTSDTPEYWFVQDGRFELWPNPSSSGNVISLNCKIRVTDLNTADVTSSTIATLANGSRALTLSAGLTAQMVGFWIRPTFSTTANTGDGHWYEIAAYTAATTGFLVRPYGGVSIATGTAACTIAQMPLLPEAFHDLPEQYAAYRYWLKERDKEMAAEFRNMVIEGTSELFRAYGVNDLSMVLSDGEDTFIGNPNLFLNL